MNRRTFLKTGAATAALLATRPAWAALPQTAKSSDEEILSQCEERIEKHRKGSGSILVRQADGKPVAGAKTDPQGELKLRAFYGQYRVAAELPGGRRLTKDLHWQRGQKNTFELTA